MFTKIVFIACVAMAYAKPSPSEVAAPLVAAAPVIAAPAPFVTASSSQYISRNYNGLVAAAPLVASAPIVAAPYTVASPYSVAAPYFAAPAPYYPSAPIVAL